MKSIFRSISLFVLLALSYYQAHASEAEIRATYGGYRMRIALDSEGVPRLNENPNSYPMLTDFKKGSDFSQVCYSGPLAKAKRLIEGLATAAYDDCDSWSVSYINHANENEIVVDSKTTRKGRKTHDIFRFILCK